jgi:hypothetical protein
MLSWPLLLSVSQNQSIILERLVQARGLHYAFGDERCPKPQEARQHLLYHLCDDGGVCDDDDGDDYQRKYFFVPRRRPVQKAKPQEPPTRKMHINKMRH